MAWLVAFGLWVVVWVWAFFNQDAGIWITERDLELMGPIVDGRTDWLTPTGRPSTSSAPICSPRSSDG